MARPDLYRKNTAVLLLTSSPGYFVGVEFHWIGSQISIFHWLVCSCLNTDQAIALYFCQSVRNFLPDLLLDVQTMLKVLCTSQIHLELSMTPYDFVAVHWCF